jgi:tetratricopeptide (TPR) repeat protein
MTGHDMTGDPMTGDDILLTTPIVAWPEQAAPGSRHVVTVDLAGPLHDDADEDPDRLGPWPWPQEELEFTVGLDGGTSFSCKALGEPLLLLHRFGGTYEPAEFLVEAGADLGPAALWLTLNNEYGVPVHAVELPVAIVPEDEIEGARPDDFAEAAGYDGYDTRPPETAAADGRPPAETFAEPVVSAPPVTVVHSGTDSAWAIWVFDVCRRRGRPIRNRTDAPGSGRTPDDLLRDAGNAATGPVVVLLSNDLLTRGGYRPEDWEAALAGLRDRLPDGLHLAAVDDGPLPGVPEGMAPIRLAGPDAGLAEEELARALGLTLTPPTARSSVRHPGSEPAAIGAVPPRNPAFTGREALLARLYRELRQSSRLVLVGMGGVGKTQLATEFAHRFASQYDVVWWVTGENMATYRWQLASLSHALGLTDGPDYGQGFRTALEALRRGSHGSWLVVVDGADVPADIRDHLPRGNGHVLITSRNAHWEAEDVRVLEVPVYDRSEAVESARARAPRLTDAEAGALAEALGDLPLALAQAAAWLANSGQTVGRYLDLLGVRQDGGTTGGLASGFSAAWSVTLRDLERNNPDALELLRLCARFAPGPVPVGMLLTLDPRTVPPRFQALVRSEESLARAADVLLRYSLVSREPAGTGAGFGPYLGLHSLVHAHARSWTPEDVREESARTVRDALTASDPGDPEDVRTWPRYEEIVRQLPYCGALTEPDAAPFVLTCLRQMYLAGEYDYGLEVAEAARDAWVGRANGDVLRELDHQYANFLRAVGDYSRSMTVSEALVGQESTDTGYIRAAGGYAADLRALGRYREALRFSRRVHAICQARTGEERDALLATSMNNLAVSLRLMGRHQEALEMDDRAADHRSGTLGGDHPWTLWSEFSVALDLRLVGRVHEALAIQEGNLRLTVELLGRDRVQTLSARLNWGRCLWAVGETAQAAREIRLMLDDAARVLGERNLLYLQTLSTAAAFECHHGDRERGMRLTADAHAGYARFLGHRHPFTLACQVNLATATAGRDPREAVRLATEAHTALAEALGHAHPWTQGSDRARQALRRGRRPDWEFEPLPI